jgi:hypothetical protein
MTSKILKTAAAWTITRWREEIDYVGEFWSPPVFGLLALIGAVLGAYFYTEEERCLNFQ